MDNRLKQHYIVQLYTIDTSTAPGQDIAQAAGATRVTPTFMLFRDEMLLLKVEGEEWMKLDRGMGKFA